LLVAALNGEDGIAQMKKKMDEEERARVIRTNEDPELVGEEAAEKNRQERLRRENGWGVLEREDKRWDWLLGMLIFYSFGVAVLVVIANGMQRKCRIGKREIRAGGNSDKSKDYRFPRILHPFVC
jgi:hypothetical protein